MLWQVLWYEDPSHSLMLLYVDVSVRWGMGKDQSGSSLHGKDSANPTCLYFIVSVFRNDFTPWNMNLDSRTQVDLSCKKLHNRYPMCKLVRLVLRLQCRVALNV